MPGVIIAIVNNKGGVGKTATATNLAYMLGMRGRKTLVIDMDTQCNSSQILMPNLWSGEGGTIMDVLDPEESPDLRLCIHHTKFRSVFCLPNRPDTAAMESDIILNAPRSFSLLRDRVRDYIIKDFDITLIDCPPNLGTFVLMSLFASDLVIVPSEASSMHSFAGLINAVEFIEKIKASKSNPDLSFLRVLITMVNKRHSIARTMIDQIRQLFPNRTFDTVIPFNIAFAHAEAERTVIFKREVKAKGAQAYRDLANELLAIIEPNTEWKHGREDTGLHEAAEAPEETPGS